MNNRVIRHNALRESLAELWIALAEFLGQGRQCSTGPSAQAEYQVPLTSVATKRILLQGGQAEAVVANEIFADEKGLDPLRRRQAQSRCRQV